MLQSVFEAFHLQRNYFPYREGAPYANAHKADDFLVSLTSSGSKLPHARVNQEGARGLDQGSA
jgi:hypothetical protein